MGVKLPKLDFPSFDGSNSREWVTKARMYFELHQIPEAKKLGITQLYVKGRAYIWLSGFLKTRRDVNWEQMVVEMCRRLGRAQTMK